MADTDEELARKITANAALLVETLSGPAGFEFGYDERSLRWLDGYIERARQRAAGDEEKTDPLISVIGSYLGEFVVRNYGGRWGRCDGDWGIVFDEKNAVFPFTMARNQFEGGHAEGDSVFGAVTSIPIVFKLARKPPP